MPPDSEPIRFELTLRRPRVGFLPKPTVVISGRGQPAQWGTGTWVVDEGSSIGVYLFNRVWRFGQAEVVVASQNRTGEYRPPFLPFGRGRLRSV